MVTKPGTRLTIHLDGQQARQEVAFDPLPPSRKNCEAIYFSGCVNGWSADARASACTRATVYSVSASSPA